MKPIQYISDHRWINRAQKCCEDLLFLISEAEKKGCFVHLPVKDYEIVMKASVSVRYLEDRLKEIQHG